MAVIAGKIAAIVCSIVGPTIAILVWLSVTFSHREEKHIVTCGIIQHIAVSDITGNSAAAQARLLALDHDPPLIQPSPPRKIPFKLPLTWAAFYNPSSHDGHSPFLSGQPNASDGQQGLLNGQSQPIAGQYCLSPSIQLAGMTHTAEVSGTAVSSTLGQSSPFTHRGSLISASRSPATAHSHIVQQVLDHQPVHKSALPFLPTPSHPNLPPIGSFLPATQILFSTTSSLSPPPPPPAVFFFLWGQPPYSSSSCPPIWSPSVDAQLHCALQFLAVGPCA